MLYHNTGYLDITLSSTTGDFNAKVSIVFLTTYFWINQLKYFAGTNIRERKKNAEVLYTSSIDLQISTGKDDPALEIASLSISKATVCSSLKLISGENLKLISADFSWHIDWGIRHDTPWVLPITSSRNLTSIVSSDSDHPLWDKVIIHLHKEQICTV